MRSVTLLLTLWIGIVAAAGDARASRQGDSPPRFDVASVRENTSAERRVSRRFLPGGRVEIRNMSLRMIIGLANRIETATEAYRINGTASVLDRKFDITATAPPTSEPASEDLLAMLKSLLADRFRLVTHTEFQPRSVYALTVAKEGELGPGLRRSEYNCHDWAGGPLETEPRDEQGNGLCGPSQQEYLPGGVRRRYAGTIARLAQMTQSTVAEVRDRLVVDMTGLEGNFQWEFAYSQRNAFGPAGDELPSVFTAFKEELGLVLEPRTVPIEVLVIDSVSLPSAN